MKLVIANKCYSSWSLRPWILLKELGIPFDEVQIPFAASFDDPGWKSEIGRYSPAGRVPALVDGEGADRVAVWESLAIMEYVAEARPDLAVWPKERAARAMARAIAAEMHAGFQALRSACIMNLGKKFPAKDRGPAVAKDVARIVALWTDARARFGRGGPFLFGAFSAADAMYAPVVTRFETYSIPVDAGTRTYMDAVMSTAAFRAWREGALAEPWIVPQDEVEEEAIANYRQTK